MPIRLLLVAATVTAVVVGAALLLLPSRAQAPHRTDVAAVALLRAWDDRRAEAWASGEPSRLRELYGTGSAAGRADRAMLRAWSARGLRVEDLEMQLVAVRVRVWTADRVVLVVTDRLARGVAVGGGVRRPLPEDHVSTRVVALARVAGEWRVDAVSPVS
ncbi:hypothetical protein ABLE68_16980 [Nocardioides sp. CN2-186]|uniref:hypothetical protein n=1 Tax=Nocardioides tweenelious TaxID=3156607 RepID=UPI0032B55CA3